MAKTTGPGRPKAISREMLAEAACELFLEQGYDETNVAEIASRAGVGRSSFFNYAASKADLLWGDLDERISELADAVSGGELPAVALRRLAEGFAPDALALAFANAETMRIKPHLERESALRAWRIAQIASRGLRRAGADPLVAEVSAGSYGAAALAAIREWAATGAGTAPLADHLERALDVLGGAGSGLD